MRIRAALAMSLLLMAEFESRAQRVRDAHTGDIAAGVVILEDQRQLRLDATPCKSTADKTIIVFKPPYKKVPLGKVTCNDKIFVKVQVIQGQSG